MLEPLEANTSCSVVAILLAPYLSSIDLESTRPHIDLVSADVLLTLLHTDHKIFDTQHLKFCNDFALLGGVSVVEAYSFV